MSIKSKSKMGASVSNESVLQQMACLMVNPITVGNITFLLNRTPAGQTSDSMTVLT